LHAAAGEECVGSDEEGIGALARKGGKGRIDLADRLALRIWICSPMVGRLPARPATWPRRSSIGRIDEHGNTNGLGHQSCRSRSRLAVTSWRKKLMPVALPPGRARLATRPSWTGSSPTPKTIGIVAVAALAASAAGVAGGRGDHGHLRRTRSATVPAGDRIGPPASGTRPSRSGLRRSRFR
jgi:hypothetical protein